MLSSAMLELSERFERTMEQHGGAVADQTARFLLNVMNLPIRNFIIPMPDGRTPYIHRFILDEGDQLVPKDKRSKVYLHFIYESDGDRDPHDHPFDFNSTILYGSYREARWERYCPKCDTIFLGDVMTCPGCKGKMQPKAQYGPRTYTEGQVNTLRAHQLHKLEVLKGPVVTLIRRGPRIRDWGFATDEGWVHHLPYIQTKFPGVKPTEID